MREYEEVLSRLGLNKKQLLHAKIERIEYS